MSVASLTNQPVVWIPANGLDGHGKSLFGVPSVLKGRITGANYTRLMPNGDPQEINAKVIIDGDPGIKINDKLQLDQDYRVIRVRPAITGTGAIHHTTYEVARWK